MLSRLKTYFWIALAIAVFYFLLSHHLIFYSFKDIDLLKKQELTLKYTFYGIRQHSTYDTMRIKELRDAGIEDILLDRGLVTDEELKKILNRIDAAK
jgi:hypothetical protein